MHYYSAIHPPIHPYKHTSMHPSFHPHSRLPPPIHRCIQPSIIHPLCMYATEEMTTITYYRPTHGTARKSQRTIAATRQSGHNKINATSSLFPSEMIATPPPPPPKKKKNKQKKPAALERIIFMCGPRGGGGRWSGPPPPPEKNHKATKQTLSLCQYSEAPSICQQ